MSDKLVIELEPDTDRMGRTYYIGKLKGPITINCKDGVAFMIFVSDKGNEELQICNMTYTKKNENG